MALNKAIAKPLGRDDLVVNTLQETDVYIYLSAGSKCSIGTLLHFDTLVASGKLRVHPWTPSSTLKLANNEPPNETARRKVVALETVIADISGYYPLHVLVQGTIKWFESFNWDLTQKTNAAFALAQWGIFLQDRTYWCDN